MNRKTDLDHYLQLRVTKRTIVQMDNAIATVPDLAGSTRCGFIRSAIGFALASLRQRGDANEGQENTR